MRLALVLLATYGFLMPGSAPGERDGRAAVLAKYALENTGDAKRGEALFREGKPLACSKCHKVRGQGGDIGPDLSDIGGKYDRVHLVEAVLEPSKEIVEGYRASVVATRDGKVFNGLIKGESNDDLTVVDVDGNRHVIAQGDIYERKSGDASFMPDDLVAGSSPEQFADLVAYLESLRSSEQPSPGSGLKGPLRLPEGFEAIPVANGFNGATALAIAPDGTVFVCEQTGTLRVVRHDELLPEPFVSLHVDSYWERGLIGVTVDPDFEKNHYVYVCYVAPEPYPHHRVSRFTADGFRASPGSEVILFEGDDQTKVTASTPAGHQGGALHFGPDGKLFLSLGEQTAGQPSQDMHALLGKMLRLNPDGSIPSDNPFLDQTEGKYRAIWALGLRNPFTFAIQPGTGRMLINDVGGNFEEINEGRPGANFGWPAVEHGPTGDSRFVGPVHWYPTSSISGGDFCPVSTEYPFPKALHGRYFFADFVKGWIKVLDPDHPSQDLEPWVSGLARPVDLRFSPDGGLYVLVRDAWVKDDAFRPYTGALIKIRYQGPSAGQ